MKSSPKGGTKRPHVQRTDAEKAEKRKEILQYAKENECTAAAACSHFNISPDKLSKWGWECLLCQSIRDKKALFDCNNSVKQEKHHVCVFCYIWKLIINNSNACPYCPGASCIIEPTADWKASATFYKQLKAEVKNKLKDIDKELQKTMNMMLMNSSKFYESYGPHDRDKERKVVDKVLDYLIQELEPARKQNNNTDKEPAYSSKMYISNKAPALLRMMDLFDKMKFLQINDQDFVQETKEEKERLIPLYEGLFHQMVNLVISCYKRTDKKMLGSGLGLGLGLETRVTRTFECEGITLQSADYMGYFPVLRENKHFEPPQIHVWKEHMQHVKHEEVLQYANDNKCDIQVACQVLDVKNHRDVSTEKCKENRETCSVCGKMDPRPRKPFVEVET